MKYYLELASDSQKKPHYNAIAEFVNGVISVRTSDMFKDCTLKFEKKSILLEWMKTGSNHRYIDKAGNSGDISEDNIPGEVLMDGAELYKDDFIDRYYIDFESIESITCFLDSLKLPVIIKHDSQGNLVMTIQDV